MNDVLLRLLRCPICSEGITPAGALNLRCTSGHTFALSGGMPDFVYPPSLQASDAEFRSKYDAGADTYDTGLDWLFQSFFENEDRVRAAMADRLGITQGDTILEIGAGSGKDSVHLLERLGASGFLVVTDLSRGMLEVAQRRVSDSEPGVAFLLCNGSYLPFGDGVFDAVFHFGGINEFSEKRRAIEEMARVTKVGGRVVFGDESVPPWLRAHAFGRVLINANKLYAHVPPLDELPVNARNVSLTWILGNAFYLISFDVAEGPPKVDFDLPIPGKGDSLRLRFERAYPGETL